jgi:hypothetical protein
MMALNGTFGLVFSGQSGVGIAYFRITDGKLVGAGLGGGFYRGDAIEDADGISLTIEQTVPAGVILAQGTSPQDLPDTKLFSVRTPPDFGDGEPFKADVPPGTVWVMIKRVSDDLAPFADGMIVRPMKATAT